MKNKVMFEDFSEDDEERLLRVKRIIEQQSGATPSNKVPRGSDGKHPDDVLKEEYINKPGKGENRGI